MKAKAAANYFLSVLSGDGERSWCVMDISDGIIAVSLLLCPFLIGISTTTGADSTTYAIEGLLG